MNAAIPTVPATDDAPVQAFAQCHQGIIAKLDELEQLPALAQAATKARRMAQSVQAFYREVVLTHHAEEEKELFPAVLASARAGEERERVQAIVIRLAQEHRGIEGRWREIEAGVRSVAQGEEAELDAPRLADFIAMYRAHADYEEREFLPLSSEILGRNHNHMAALGMSLHLRHALPEVLRRFGTYL
jgi:hemerythrin-like domain-containing protein